MMPSETHSVVLCLLSVLRLIAPVSACGNWILPCPTANIKGVCNFNGAIFNIQRMKDNLGDAYCFANPKEHCQVSSGGASIPWADNSDRLHDGHYIKIYDGSEGKGVHFFCIWQDGGKIFGAPDCQYAKKEQLGEAPGSWNVVVNPTGDISLWVAQASKPCPDAPKPA